MLKIAEVAVFPYNLKENSMDKIRVGIIGCGGIFRGLHAPYYQETDAPC